MRFTPCCDWDFHSSVDKIQATDCDDAMTTGPQDHVSLTPELEIVGWGKPTPIHNQKTNAPELDETENETPPEAPDNGTKSSTTSPVVLDLVDDGADMNTEISGNTNTDNKSNTDVQPGSRACTEIPSKPQSEAEHVEIQATPAAERDDDSELEIIETRSVPALKRKPSAATVEVPAKKRAKLDDAPSSEQEGEPAPAIKAIPARFIESDSSEEENDSDDEESEDSRATKALAAAREALTRACKKCKVDANKALKHTYEYHILKLKYEHRDERRDIKERGDQKLRDSKKTANGVQRDMKSRYEEGIHSLKNAQAKKIKDLKTKHKSAIEAWQDKHEDDEGKIKELINERDTAIAKRKEIEKSTVTQVRDAKKDLVAGERKFREERKQMLRESREEIAQLKPEHSNIVKNNETIIKEMTQHIMNLEHELGATQRDLTAFQTDSAANRQRYDNCKIQLAHSQKETSKAKEGLHALEKYASDVEKRAQTEVARAKEKHEITIANLREQSERVITLQRENYKLKDSVQVLSKLGRETREEARRLKAELEATKTELGLDIAEALDSVEQT